MCEIKRAALVSLHVSLPCARSCFTCRANRYLRTQREMVIMHVEMADVQRGQGRSAPKSVQLLTPGNLSTYQELRKVYKPRKKSLRGWNEFLVPLFRKYSPLLKGARRRLLSAFQTMNETFPFL